MSDEDTSPEKRRGIAIRICGLCGCLLLLTIVALLIAYGVRLGTGDEAHTVGTRGTCREGTTGDGALKLMTLNAFLINCSPGAKCQEEDAREARVGELTSWFNDREEDVVLVQEVWSFHDLLRDGMVQAGYCHYAMTEGSTGSGLALFSRYPITEMDFVDWFDAFGIGGGMAPNPFNFEAYVADKGVLYGKIGKNGRPIHVFNLHTQSDSIGDNHDVRMKQFELARDFVVSKEIPQDEFVVLGGDFNEDKDCSVNSCGGAKCEGQAYYNEMVEMLSVNAADTISNTTFTYNTEANDLLKSLYAKADCDYYEYTLDYIFYSENHLAALGSSYCETLDSLATDGIDLSDHLPVACTYDLPIV